MGDKMNNNDTNQIIFRAARSQREIEELLVLHKNVYLNSRLAGIVSSNGRMIDNTIDKWDSASTHFGLYQHCDGFDRALGYVRVTECDPLTRRLPQNDYAPAIGDIVDNLVDEALSAGRKTISICHLSLDRSARSTKMARTFISCIFAAAVADGVDTGLFTANTSHARLYEKFGFSAPNEMNGASFELAGNQLTLLVGRASQLPSPAREVVSALARQYARESRISFALPPSRAQRLPQAAALKRVA